VLFYCGEKFLKEIKLIPEPNQNMHTESKQQETNQAELKQAISQQSLADSQLFAESLSLEQSRPVSHSSRSGKRTLLYVFLVCFVPVVLAYSAYFTRFFEGRNNYGTLIDPQRDIPKTLEARTLSGEPFDIQKLKGKWILFQVASSQCAEPCQMLMFYQRQIRTSTGKERDRIERVVFVVDDGPLETMLLRQFEGVHFVRVNVHQLQQWLPLPQADPANLSALQEHVFVADPLGHIMMRFPVNPDPARMRKDISKLLWTSKIG
jgi:hypothetical protein